MQPLSDMQHNGRGKWQNQTWSIILAVSKAVFSRILATSNQPVAGLQIVIANELSSLSYFVVTE
jgi:hypothetical protein